MKPFESSERAEYFSTVHNEWTLHYGKLSVTRWTIILGAKISTFVDILGLFDQVERVLDIYFTHFSLRKAS